VVCVSVLQVLGPHEAAQLVKRVGGWLRPGGRLVIAGIGVLGDDRRSPRDAAVHNILFGTLYEAGRAYTLAEHISWLQDAGFADVRTEWLDDGRGAVRGVRT
jgi:cyclopropane fatty-acyl-phospholipid synthase-like methyltransferase